MPTDTRTRLLVTPDRDAAESAAETITDAGLSSAAPRVVREALAGEDDAEDAQWLVIVEAPKDGWTSKALITLDEIATEFEGWLETAD